MTCATAALLLALAAPATGDGTFKTADGVSIYYRSVGLGAETVVIPIAGLTSTDFDALAKGRRVVYYSPRGRGRSPRRCAASPSRCSRWRSSSSRSGRGSTRSRRACSASPTTTASTRS